MYTFFPVLLNAFSLLIIKISADSSCETECTYEPTGRPDARKTTPTPRCGLWLHADNSEYTDGIYIIEKNVMNLTCSVSSLPRPATVKWMFQAEDARRGHVDRRQPVSCTSSRTTVDCKFNSFGEHLVTSICLLDAQKLEQSGVYFCTGTASDGKSVESRPHRIQVYGVSNITMDDYSELFTTLQYGRIGQIRVRVCAHPKPTLLWIHKPTGLTLPDGASVHNVSASHLQHALDFSSVSLYGPIHHFKYCYVAELWIGKVQEDSHLWSVMAWNNVDVRRLDIPVKVAGVPRKSGGAKIMSRIHWMMASLGILYMIT